MVVGWLVKALLNIYSKNSQNASQYETFWFKPSPYKGSGSVQLAPEMHETSVA